MANVFQDVKKTGIVAAKIQNVSKENVLNLAKIITNAAQLNPIVMQIS